MGYDAERACGLLRLSLGRFNTQAEVDRFLKTLSEALATLDELHAQSQLRQVIEAETLAVS